MRLRPLVLLFLFANALALGLARDARAQQPVSPATLPVRRANYAWDGALLRASFSYRDLVDADLARKLSNGLRTTFAVRAYVFRDGESEPAALTVRTCKVAYDLWDEVYRVEVVEPGRERDTAVLSIEGVVRLCAEARDLIVANRSLLAPGQAHFLAVIVDVNPISPQILEQMRRWVARPTGSTSIGPGDALFGSFAGLFVRQIQSADKTLRFRTQPIIP